MFSPLAGALLTVRLRLMHYGPPHHVVTRDIHRNRKRDCPGRQAGGRRSAGACLPLSGWARQHSTGAGSINAARGCSHPAGATQVVVPIGAEPTRDSAAQPAAGIAARYHGIAARRTAQPGASHPPPAGSNLTIAIFGA
jgi:hypothetical protein